MMETGVILNLLEQSPIPIEFYSSLSELSPETVQTLIEIFPYLVASASKLRQGEDTKLIVSKEDEGVDRIKLEGYGLHEKSIVIDVIPGVGRFIFSNYMLPIVDIPKLIILNSKPLYEAVPDLRRLAALTFMFGIPNLTEDLLLSIIENYTTNPEFYKGQWEFYKRVAEAGIAFPCLSLRGDNKTDVFVIKNGKAYRLRPISCTVDETLRKLINLLTREGIDATLVSREYWTYITLPEDRYVLKLDFQDYPPLIDVLLPVNDEPIFETYKNYFWRFLNKYQKYYKRNLGLLETIIDKAIQATFAQLACIGARPEMEELSSEGRKLVKLIYDLF